MASIPYLSQLIEAVIGPLFEVVGADPSIAATSVIAVDMGGYQLAAELAQSVEGWMMATVTGYMAGATIVFSIPVGLTMLARRDHEYLALGVMAGILSVPFGVLSACLILWLARPEVRGGVPAFPAETYALQLDLASIGVNLLPLVVFVVALAIGLAFVPQAMIRAFMVFGRIMDVLIKLVLVASIVEMTTSGFFGGSGGAVSAVAGGFGFDPIIADAADPVRALEVAGYIGMMLCGAFPMVYLLRKWLTRPVERYGRRLGLEPVGAAGLLASVANVLATFRLVGDMRPRDKGVNIAFAVCAAFLLGDHLAFTSNFQPALVVPVLAGKLVGGVVAVVLAHVLAARRFG